MEEGASGHEDVGIFGTISSGSPPASVSARIRQAVNLFKIDGLAPSTEQLIIGNNILDSGFAAVIFSGKELHAKFNYALGWHPIGREMPIEPGRTQGLGESALARIDGMPAAQIYKEYLGVPTNSYLITNICEFPLLVRRGGTDICLIPFNYGDNGELYFSTSVYEGEKLRFSFASQDEILCASAESARSMEDFAPDALFLILCGNRINFLRDDASLEWNVFDHIAPDYALIHGASELFYINGSGGVMNSAHLAIGLREGDKPDNLLEHFEPGDYMHHEGFIPLSERMSVFLNKMTGQLIGVAKEAYAANQAKSAFLSNMSHEIRTPINAILGMDEMILRESGEPEIIKYAEDIRSAGNSLLGIVNDILDFSKIEASKMNILPVEYEFLSVINDLYNMIRNRADKKGLKLELKVDPNIPSILYGDEIRIKQVITNILTNAVKYTEKGSVTLSVKRVDSTEHVTIGKDSDYHGEMCLTHPVILSVSVKDTGIGIKDSDKARLFGAFERLDEGHNRTIEGTGLGLNITRQLLELMGSTLNVKSTYGEGSVFSFDITQGIVRDIPIGEISERFAKTSAVKRLYHESFTAEAARILVVDDTSMNLEVMRGLLKKTRILIDTAESGDEALKLVTENAYDVIF
ncbi:MAG TPA: hypothetical protein DCL38_01620, partial [Lachnospiraceae bacterium]|nr:hypothetical protein [Lachnospiraceae bacterium]